MVERHLMGDHRASVMSAVYCGSSISNSAARDLRPMLTGGFFISHQDENTEYLLITVTCRHPKAQRLCHSQLEGENLIHNIEWVGLSAVGEGCENKHASVATLGLCVKINTQVTAEFYRQKREESWGGEGVGKEVGIHYISSTFSSSAPTARDSKHWLLP